MNGNDNLRWSSVSKLLTVSRTHSQEFNWEKQRKWTCMWNWASHSVRPSKSWTEMTAYLEARFHYSLLFLKTFCYQCFKKLGRWGQPYSGFRKAKINWNAMEWEEDYGGFHRGRGGRGRRKIRHGHKGCLIPLCKLRYFYCHFTTIE